MWLNRRALLPTFCLETRSPSTVLSFDAMGWTESCQKARWNQYTTTQWIAWVGTLPEEGFGRLTKIGWSEWTQKMLDAHGPSTKDAPTTATEDVNQADLRVGREQVNQEDPTRE